MGQLLKIREFKRRISKLNIKKLKISPNKIILSSADNMNNVQSMVKVLMKLKKNHYLVKDMEHFSIFIREKKRNLFNTELIGMIITNTRQKEEN